MKIKFYYPVGENTGRLWFSPFCEVVDFEKYDMGYSKYLAESTYLQDSISSIDRKLAEVKKVENEELECYETGTELFEINVYKDRVEFFDFESEDENVDWTCTFEEFKRFLLGKRAFLMLPKEKESYLEIKINDIE